MIEHFPTVVRLGNFLRGRSPRRVYLRLVFGTACLVTGVALVAAVENWRLAREWRTWRASAEARGERFDWASIIPVMPPPERNFAATPLFRPIFDYAPDAQGKAVFRDPDGQRRVQNIDVLDRNKPGPRPPGLVSWATGSPVDLAAWADAFHRNVNYPAVTDGLAPVPAVLAALSQFDAALAELREAAGRPESVFPVHYTDGPLVVFPHLSVLQKLETVAVLHALAVAQSGPADQAFDELMFTQRLAEALRVEPALVSVRVRVMQHRVALQPVWEALAARRLTEAQLAQLQGSLAAVNYVGQLTLAVRGERAFSQVVMEGVRTGSFDLQAMYGGNRVPALLRLGTLCSGLFYRSELVVGRYYTEDVLPALDAKRGTADLPAIAAATARLEPAMKSRFNVLVGVLTPNFTSAFSSVLCGQANQNMAVAACALERWRLAHDTYPETLDALVPGLLEKLPVDPVNGRPLHYRRTPAGRYLLYSLGGGGQDTGAGATMTNGREDAGDWVWSYEKREAGD